MSSGKKIVVINPQERVVSSDINRLQAFDAYGQAELLRYMLDVTAEDDLQAAAIVTEYSTTGTPLRAEIINGLLVRPQLASFDLFVDPGAVMMLAPDAGPDDSNYKAIRDAGIQSAATLTITANASGSTRFDVIECQINGSPGIVTATRDVFNTVTGAFSPTLLTKEQAGRLTYRVRAGTPGAGFPGTTSGWLPLTVAMVPNGAASNDAITFWDVRPLISDRQFQPFALSAIGQILSLDGCVVRNSSSDVRLTGVARAVYQGRRIGGMIRRGTPGTDGDFLNLADSANQDPATPIAEPWTPVVSLYQYLYLMFPFSLPRWARYTDAVFGSRVPRAPRGIPVASLVAPNPITNEPSAPIGLPTFGGTSSTGFCFAVESRGSGNIFDSPNMANKIVSMAQPSGMSVTGTYSNITGQTDFTIVNTAGLEIAPRNAKFMLATIAGDFTVPANTSHNGISNISLFRNNVSGFANQYATYILPSLTLVNQTGAGAVRSYTTGMFRIPMPVAYPGSLTFPRLIRWQTASGMTASGNPVLSLYGFEL